MIQIDEEHARDDQLNIKEKRIKEESPNKHFQTDLLKDLEIM